MQKQECYSSKMYMFMSTKMWIRAVKLMLKALLHCKVDLVLKINASFFSRLYN